MVICGVSREPLEVTMAGGVELERSGARVGKASAGLLDLEEPVALNDKIQRIAGLGKTALREDDFVGCARVPRRAGVRREPRWTGCGGAGLHQGLVEQILKLRAPCL